MQGDSAVQDLDFQRALEASPFEEKDLPELSSQIGSAYTRLTPEQKQQLQELADELDTFSGEELRNMRYFLTYLSQNRQRYGEILQKMYEMGVIEEGGVPEEYNPAFFSVLSGLVDQTIAKRGESETEKEAPQGFAKGGIANLKVAARRVREAGRDGDTVLAHITPAEAALLKRSGGAGSINPKTGLPEFKSFWSKAWGVIKKAAPIILPFALNFLVPGLGAIASGFIGSGVGALIGGAKPKDALKSALFGAITGGVMSGISGAVSGTGTGFMSGVEGALPSGFGGPPVAAGTPSFVDNVKDTLGFNAATGTPAVDAAAASVGGTLPPVPTTVVADVPKVFAGAGTPPVAPATPATGTGIGSLVGKTTTWMSANPLKTAALAAGAGALAANAFGGEEIIAPGTPTKSGVQLLAENPLKYGVNIQKYRPTTGMGLFSAATGGLAAKGGKVDGPGTGTSDSIPARLSDGEFVFTAKAVRGAGNGSRMKGAKKMYELMHKFERMA